jgi:type II secretory pathway pseudopilin PulG
MASTRAITLPELLIGLVVLFILLVLLFPARSSVGLDSSPKAQAKNDVVQIATAVTAYETEYGRLPSTNSGAVGGEILTVLLGEKSPLNPREIVFLEVQSAKKGKSGLRNGIFVDPWGGPYQIACDIDGDGFVTAGTNAVSVPKNVAVWNDPRLGTKEWFANDQKRNKRYVTSW